MKFFIGIFNVRHAAEFDACCISVNTLEGRKSDFAVKDWILDSGAFSKLSRDGGYKQSVSSYAQKIKRWGSNGNLLAAVTEDYMCEPQMLARTGLTVEKHQQLTMERYCELLTFGCNVPILPVLQGYLPQDYVQHIEMYGPLLEKGMWVGVGSVCKRNRDVFSIEDVLSTINRKRPDLRLHGFGVKKTALTSEYVQKTLYSADSMAWSFQARRDGRDANSCETAKQWLADFNSREIKPALVPTLL
jgi:hypothetical protein